MIAARTLYPRFVYLYLSPGFDSAGVVARTLKKVLAGVAGQLGSTDRQPGLVEREVMDGREVLRGIKRAIVAIDPIRRPQFALFLQLEDGCRL